jgi:toxin ParE1/3/4
MRKLLIQPQARLDLLEIWHHIAQDNVRAANQVNEKLDAAICSLLTMPGMGHARADVKDVRYKFWSVFSYVIAYRYNDATLTIVRVVHGSRDFRKLFRHP